MRAVLIHRRAGSTPAFAILRFMLAFAPLLGACRKTQAQVPGACPGSTCEVACPRDAEVDATGRCACHTGDVRVLGACVPPPVADAYCGRAARASGQGCAFVACGPEEAADVDVGCVPIVSLAHGGGGPAVCPPDAALVVASGHTACVPPDAACPRGSQARGASCVRPAGCPPGTLGSEGSCRPVVLRGAGGGTLTKTGGTIVDVGAWAALVLGRDGGAGSADLCRPLQARPAAFGVERGETLTVEVSVAITVPDEDVTGVLADVRVTPSPGAHPLPPAAAPLADTAVATLLEPLRGLGGEASATRVESRLKCVVTSL
jgi:hypothetical protein